MCTDCGCSIRGSEEHTHTHAEERESHSHSHTHTEEHHSHEHQKAHEHLHHNPQLNDSKTILVIQKILDKNKKKVLKDQCFFLTLLLLLLSYFVCTFASTKIGTYHQVG